MLDCLDAWGSDGLAGWRSLAWGFDLVLSRFLCHLLNTFRSEVNVIVVSGLVQNTSCLPDSRGKRSCFNLS